MYQLLCVLLIIVFLITSPKSTAKKRCKPLLEKLHNVQAMQRKGYSASRGDSLRAKEDKARDKWWQCEQGKDKKVKKRGKKKVYGKTKKNKRRSLSNKKIKAGIPFKTSHAIVVSSKYQGDKKQAWHQYYRQPLKCQRPKSLSDFAYCSENKQMQRTDFEKQYSQ